MTSEKEVLEVDQGRIDDVIWKYSGIKSVRWIADQTGVKPDDVLRRKKELLDEVDSLTIQEKRQRFLVELDGMARDARDRASRTDDEFYSGMLNSSIGAIKEVLRELARMEKQDAGKIEALNQMRVQELLRLVDLTVQKSIVEISLKHDIPEDELMEVFQSRLVDAAQQIESSSV